MKQEIDIKQLEDLSHEEQLTVAKLFFGENVSSMETVLVEEPHTLSSLLYSNKSNLNIGKLMEILEELNYDKLCYELECHSRRVYYRNNNDEDERWQKEFFDELWNALLECLKDKA